MNTGIKKVSLLLSVLSFSILICAAIYAWTEPSVAPTGGNISAPINTGSLTQTKNGDFNIMGLMGIGTTSPSQKFEVAGNIKGHGLCIGDDCCTNWAECVALGGGNSCKSIGASCGINEDCCSSTCTSGVCANGSGGCKAIGNACTADSACCSSLCTGGICANLPSCKANGLACSTSADCCSSSCSGGICTGGSGCKDSLAKCTTNADCCTGTCFSGSCTFYYPCKNIDLPAGSKKIFVTSAPYLGNQILNDAAANAKCNEMGAELSPSPNYKALVYLGGQLQTDIIHNVSYWNPQKVGTECKWEIIGSGSGDFFSLNADGVNYITKPILCDEKGGCVSNRRVWTNFKPNGSGGATQLWVGNGKGGITSSNSGRKCPTCCWQLGVFYCKMAQYGPCLEQNSNDTRWDTFYWYGINSRSDIGWSFAGAYDPQAGLSTCSLSTGVKGPACMNNESAALYCVEQ